MSGNIVIGTEGEPNSLHQHYSRMVSRLHVSANVSVFTVIATLLAATSDRRVPCKQKACSGG
jgi:hypothetical protein